MTTPELRSFAAETAQSPAPYFAAGNALVNWETNPLIAAAFAAGVTTQTLARYFSNRGENLNGPTLKFMTGPQGALATNALITLGVSAFTLASGGSLLLAVAALAFGAANLGQSLIYGGKAKFKKDIHKNFALAACEVAMIGGFLAVAAHVALPVAGLLTIAGVGAALATMRILKPKAIHPDLVYADMLITAGLTCAQAAFAPGPHHMMIAASRLLAMIGVSRLCVQRANNEGKTSIFKVEQHIPNAYRWCKRLAGFEK